MNNLSEGMLEFDGIIVNKNTTIKDIEDAAYDALYKRLELLNEIYKEDQGIK